MPSAESVKNLIRKIATNYKMPYFTITPTFSICPKHGYLAGEHYFCPKCDEEQGLVEGENEEVKVEIENINNAAIEENEIVTSKDIERNIIDAMM